jgi:WD40 repeat protein
MWLLQFRLVGCTLRQILLQLYCPLRRRREDLTSDRWLLVILVPPSATVLVALIACLLAYGQAGQFVVGAAIAIILAALAYTLLCIQASFFGPTAHEAEQILAGVRKEHQEIRGQIDMSRSHSAAGQSATPRQPPQSASARRVAPPDPFSAAQAICRSVPEGRETASRLIAVFRGYYGMSHFSHDSRALALVREVNERRFGDPSENMGTSDKVVEVWDIATRKCRTVLQVGNRFTGGQRACYSPEGTLLAVGCRDGTVQLWDARSDQCVSTLRQHHSGDQHIPAAIAFSSNGTLMAVGFSSYDRRDDSYHNVDIWDVSSRRCIASFPVPDVFRVFDLWLAFDATGCFLAVASAGWIQLLQVGTSNCVGTYKVQERESLQAVGFDEQGRLAALARAIASGNLLVHQWCLRFWNVSTRGQLVATAPQPVTLPPGAKGISLVSSDFRLMAIPVADACSEIWDTRGGRIASVAGVPSAFSPDQQMLVTSLDKAFLGSEPPWGCGLWVIAPQDKAEVACRAGGACAT